MKYRKLGNTGLMVSEVGFGGEHIENTSAENVKAVIDTALEAGVNIIDCFMPGATIRTDMGNALKGRRDKVVLQGHIGAIVKNGQYARSRDVKLCEEFINDFLKRFHTDYIDLGMLHLIDTEEEYKKCFESDYLELAKSLKKQGKIRFIGASSHDPVIAAKMVESGVIDSLLFSINPAFDLLPAEVSAFKFMEDKTAIHDNYTIDPKRARLYSLCEEKGVGIAVMKSLAAGRLLRAEDTPFSAPLTASQCIAYALDRPAVASVLVGTKTPDEMRDCLKYVNASAEERDYSAIAKGENCGMTGQCMYCNHCLPCAAGIDIAAVTKYLDIAKVSGVSGTLAAHYESLEAHGGDCVKCGLCETRCPFGVKTMENMAEAAKVFGK